MAELGVTALAAILTGIGVAWLGTVVVLVVVIIRANQRHKQDLRDLEERGVVLAQSQAGESKPEKIARPRAVLRRNTILPFNGKSGWGALRSVETINTPQHIPQDPPHYAPQRPQRPRNPRLSWPFSARRASGNALQMRKMRVSVLSTVIESPKPSPLVPILGRSSHGGEGSSPEKSGSRPSSDQSLLRHHPALRNTWQDGGAQAFTTAQAEAIRRSSSTRAVSNTELPVRPNRSKSVAALPTFDKNSMMSQTPRPLSHDRAPSVISQASGHVPNAPIPPLPLEIARLKSQEPRRSQLARSPSHVSVSSQGSAGSSILATQSSPIFPRSRNLRLHAVSKRDWRSSMVVGPRAQKEHGHGRNQRSQGSIRSSTARFSVETGWDPRQSQAESRSSTITNGSSTHSIRVKTAESVTLSKVSSPSCSPVTVRSYTPRRRSNPQVTTYGSPEERHRTPAPMQNSAGNSSILQRQLSQASTQASSTRSSNGNPFQWDPAPLSSGKPSALKGSPSARKGHRRQNCVRISLAPTILGPSSRSPSPSVMNDIQEESPNASTEHRNSIGTGGSGTRSIPRPPSTSIFAPDVKIPTTSLQASLAPTSPTHVSAPYDHEAVSPRGTSMTDNKRMSNGSPLSIPPFPSPCHDLPSVNYDGSAPPTFALSRPSNEYGPEMSPIPPSSPFDMYVADIASSPEQPLLGDEYDSVYPAAMSHTPTRNSLTGTLLAVDRNREQSESALDSPPCSPKTLRTPSSPPNPPSQNIEGRPVVDTIDPAVLTKDPFSTLNSGFDSSTYSAQNATNGQHMYPLPNSPGSAQPMVGPLLEAAFPSSPPAQNDNNNADYNGFNPLPSLQSSPSSAYSHPSPSPSPSASPSILPPCSPRPRNAELPTTTTPSLNFAAMPTLTPSLCGPRGSPPRPLRTSIAALRRMNSDAEKGGKEKSGRGERRYLRLGREDSIALPGEESYLDELDDEGSGRSEDDRTLDEEEGRRLVGSSLLDWEEEAATLDVEEATTMKNDTVAGASASSSSKSQPESKDATGNGKKEKEPQTLSVNNDKNSFPADVSKQSPTTTSPTTKPPSADANRSSSIWEDGEKFWHSTPPGPFPVTSPSKPKNNNYLPLSSSPLSVSVSASTSPRAKRPRPSLGVGNGNVMSSGTPTRRKRAFEVAKDGDGGNSALSPISPTQVENRTPEYAAGERRFRFSNEGFAAGEYDGYGACSPAARRQGQRQRQRGTLHAAAPTASPAPPPSAPASRSPQHSRARPSTTTAAAPSGSGTSGNRYRKRSALAGMAISTPNMVRIRVQPPSGGSVRGGDGRGTPGSLYDAEGFLRG